MIKVLLIEDNYLLRELYIRVIHKAGFEALAAIDGEEGLKIASEQNPALILLDIMIPKLNGIEVLKKLKENPGTSGIPVYLLTNLGQETIIRQALDIGAEKYLLKTNTPPHKLIELITSFAENAAT